MSIHTISKGVVINFIVDILLMMFLVYYKFDIPAQVFSGILLVVLFVVSVYTGAKSKRFSQAHGFFVGLVSAVLMVLSLYVTVDMNWELNGIIAIVWSFVGFIGAWIGGLKNGKQPLFKKRKKMMTKEAEVI